MSSSSFREPDLGNYSFIWEICEKVGRPFGLLVKTAAFSTVHLGFHSGGLGDKIEQKCSFCDQRWPVC